MPEAGEYLFTRVGFSHDELPVFTPSKDDTLYTLEPLNQDLTLRFKMTQRFCVGWGNIATGQQSVCPDYNLVDDAYEQCAACQQRTGFNPAFYHASHVSSQQEARNLEPHMLYLAYFGKDTVKVGISHAARNNARLLEQGARYALILETFPSAHIAREYEAKITKISGIVETIQLRKKIALLNQPLDSEQATTTLLTTRQQIEELFNITFSRNHVQSFDARFFPKTRPDFAMAHDCSDQHVISGTVTGMLGSLLFCQQADNSVFLPLKKYLGYRMTISYEHTPLIIPARQISLF